MNATCSLQTWRQLAEEAETGLQRKLGVSREVARERLAGKIGWAPGTLYNLARDRLKKLDVDLRAKLAAYAADELEAEIATLTARLEVVRSLRGSQDPKLVGKIEAVLASAQKLHAAMGGDNV